MKRLLILALLLTACAGPQPQLVTVAEAAPPSECRTIYTFEDGASLQLCQPPIDPGDEPTETATLEPTATEIPAPTDTATPTATPAGPVAPYPDAPACAEHSTSEFHTLWNETLGCHYDHEHGTSPFTPEVAALFPGLDLHALLGAVQIGHTNPSSPMENTHKHPGFKWDVRLVNYQGCKGRENVPTGVSAFAVQYHAFGDYSVEFETRIHSAVGLLRQCQAANPGDYGYVYTVQHQDYGQRTAPYQGVVLPYPDTPLPAYDPAREPYFAVTCFGGVGKCGKYATLAALLGGSAETTWISEPQYITGSGSSLFFLLFRARDTFQALDAADMVYPFTYRWLCGGAVYDPTACRYNNTTTKVHELGGEIPEAWDGQPFDADPRPGRITADLYVTRFGALAPDCTAPGPDCHPLKLVQAFTGQYGTGLGITPTKTEAFNVANLPERDIYFLNGQVVSEFTPGAVASGWVGPAN